MCRALVAVRAARIVLSHWQAVSSVIATDECLAREVHMVLAAAKSYSAHGVAAEGQLRPLDRPLHCALFAFPQAATDALLPMLDHRPESTEQGLPQAHIFSLAKARFLEFNCNLGGSEVAASTATVLLRRLANLFAQREGERRL